MATTAFDLVAGPSRAAALLHPMRMRILHALREPGSASTVARELEVPRQKVNYHLRELEKAGFLELVEERRAGNCIERVVRATAAHFLINPEIMGSLGTDPETVQDRFSSTYLIALAAETIRDVAAGRDQADKSKKRLATFALQADVRFADAVAREAFTTELSNAMARLIAKYHDENAEGGRRFRFVVGAYPARKKEKKRA